MVTRVFLWYILSFYSEVIKHVYSKLWAILTYHNNILEQCTLRVRSVKMFKNVGLYSRGTGLWQCQGERTLPPMWPGFSSSPMPHVGWVCCWFSPCFVGFSLGSLVFLPPKNQCSKIQFNQDKGGPAWKPAKADVVISLTFVIKFFYMYFQISEMEQRVQKLETILGSDPTHLVDNKLFLCICISLLKCLQTQKFLLQN